MSPVAEAFLTKIALAYKQAAEEVGAVAMSPQPEKATDPDMERQKMRDGISTAFNTTETMDRAVPSSMPEPGMLHRSMT